MPTLLVRCAGKKADGVVNSASSMRAIGKVRREGAPVGIHVHTKLDEHGRRVFEDYFDRAEMLSRMKEARHRFLNAFGLDARIFGMGNLACSCEPVAGLPSTLGIELDIGDIISPKYLQNVYDYRSDSWRTDFPVFKHDIWWIPLGTDGIEGDQGRGWLGLWAKQDTSVCEGIFSRYRTIAESNPHRLVVISSVVHPPETLKLWDTWVDMHSIAKDNGVGSIASVQALDMLRR